MTPKLPSEVRDRAARAAWNAMYPAAGERIRDRGFEINRKQMRAAVVAVVEVVGEYMAGCEHLDGPYRLLLAERDELRGRLRHVVHCLADFVDRNTVTPGPGDIEVLHAAQKALTRSYAGKLVTPDTEDQDVAEPVLGKSHDGVYPRCVWCRGENYALAVMSYSRGETRCAAVNGCGRKLPEDYIKLVWRGDELGLLG